MALNVDAAMLAGAIRARNLTPKSVARQAAVSERTLRRLTLGETDRVSERTAEALARVLDIPLEFIARTRDVA